MALQVSGNFSTIKDGVSVTLGRDQSSTSTAFNSMEQFVSPIQINKGHNSPTPGFRQQRRNPGGTPRTPTPRPRMEVRSCSIIHPNWQMGSISRNRRRDGLGGLNQPLAADTRNRDARRLLFHQKGVKATHKRGIIHSHTTAGTRVVRMYTLTQSSPNETTSTRGLLALLA